MKHTKDCNINSNVGIPKVQKDEIYCDCKTSEKVWNDAVYSSYVSKIRSILIPFTDELGWDDSKKHRDAFNKAFGQLVDLLRKV